MTGFMFEELGGGVTLPGKASEGLCGGPCAEISGGDVMLSGFSIDSMPLKLLPQASDPKQRLHVIIIKGATGN